MSLATKIVKVSAIASAGVFLWNQVKKVTDNLWHNLKIDIPFEEIRIDLGITNSIVSSTVVIDNHYNISFELTNLHSTVFVKNRNGELSEIGNTPPGFRPIHIGKRGRKKINDIKVRVNNLNLITQGISALKQPAGERLMIRTSFNINGFPFEQDVWY